MLLMPALSARARPAGAWRRRAQRGAHPHARSAHESVAKRAHSFATEYLVKESLAVTNCVQYVRAGPSRIAHRVRPSFACPNAGVGAASSSADSINIIFIIV